MAQQIVQATTTNMTQPVPVEASAAAGEDPNDDNRPNNTINTYRMLYRFLPTGSCTLEFGHDNENLIHLRYSSCGCQVDQTVSAVQSLQVCRQPVCHCLRLTRDAVLSFVVAFLFHLLPSIVWGAEESLGSSSNHQLMGAVWFLGWPIWFAVMQVLWRPWGIQITTAAKGDWFVPFDSWQHVTDVVAWWPTNKSSNEPVPARPRPLMFDPWFLFGWLFSLVLVTNMFVTGVLVFQCNERGCCKDDESTLDCCVETGYPEC